MQSLWAKGLVTLLILVIAVAALWPSDTEAIPFLVPIAVGAGAVALGNILWPEVVGSLTNIALTGAADIGLKVFAFIVGGIIMIGVALAQQLMLLAGWFMQASLEIPIIRDAAGDPSWAMETGWAFTRNLVNMLFILILAWIGIATILRLREYQTGQILMRLLIIALLVNFSPILVGVFVDMSNLIIGFFILDIVAPADDGAHNPIDALLAQDEDNPDNEGILGRAMKNVATTFASIFGEEAAGLDDTFEKLLTMVGYGLFFWMAVFVFGSLVALFFLRVVWFWLLLIVAPLAFVAYILPQTKQLWDWWWKQLLKWTFAGIAASFFLFLSFSFLAATGDAGTPENTYFAEDGERSFNAAAERRFADDQEESGLIGVAVELMPLFATLIFLGMSSAVGFSAGNIGAATALAIARKGGARFVRSTGRGIGRGLQVGGARIMRTRPMRNLTERMATIPRASTSLQNAKTPWGKAGVMLATATGARWATRRLGRAAGGLSQSQVARAREREKGLKGKLFEEQAESFHGAFFDEERAGSFVAMLKDGNLKKFRKNLETRMTTGQADKTIVNTAQQAIKIHPELAKDVMKSLFPMAQQIRAGLSESERERAGLNFDEKDIQKYGRLSEGGMELKLGHSIKPKDMENIDTELIKKLLDKNSESHDEQFDKTFTRLINQFWNGKQLSSAAQEFGSSFVDIANDRLNINDQIVKYNNPSGAQFSVSTAAQESGIMPQTRLSSGRIGGISTRVNAPEHTREGYEQINKDHQSIRAEVKKLEAIAGGLTGEERKILNDLRDEKDLTGKQKSQKDLLEKKEEGLDAEGMRNLDNLRDERRLLVLAKRQRRAELQGEAPSSSDEEADEEISDKAEVKRKEPEGEDATFGDRDFRS